MVSFNLHFLSRDRRGFSLVELLVSMTIILLLITVVTVNFREGIRNEELKSVSKTMVEDLNRMHNLALAGQVLKGTQPPEVPSAYGVLIGTVPATQYTMYADNTVDANLYYDNSDTVLDNGTVTLPEDVSIVRIVLGETEVTGDLSVAYEPPKPRIHFFDGEVEGETPLNVYFKHAVTEDCRAVTLNRLTGQVSEDVVSCL